MTTSVKTLGLARDQLASFLKNHEQIRQFENLFASVLELVEATTQVSLAALEGRVNQLVALTDEQRKAIEGLQCAPPALVPKRTRYGQFLDLTTQVAGAADTATAIAYDTTDISNGVFLRPGNTEIEVDTEGLYDFQFSIQLDKTSGGVGNFWIWPRKNGTDVPDSASQVRIQGNNNEVFCAANFFIDMNAGDYVEFMFAVSDTSVQLQTFSASAFHPAIPSIIVTVSNNIRSY